MKKTFISALTLVTLFVSCQRNSLDPTSGGLTLKAPRFGAESSAFAFEYFQTLLANERQDNVVVSPLSLHIALGMLLNGTDGQTAEELKTALRLKGYSPEAYNEVYQQLVKGLPNVDSRVTLAMANSVWSRPGFTPEVPYINQLKNTFDAEAKTLSNDPAPLNAWVNDKTQGRISKMFEAIDPTTVLMLLNAVYFKGDWRFAFDEKATYTGTWHYEDNRDKLHRVSIMQQETTLRQAFTPEYSAVELPYGNGAFRMTIVLPRQGLTTNSLVKTFDADAWNSLRERLVEDKIIVGLPRFEFDYEHKPDLNNLLQAMGIREVFQDGRANLSKMFRDYDGFYVSEVRQKANIRTDEKGSEAAAVTSVSVSYKSASGPQVKRIVCDRPFVFFISEQGSNTILFAGRVGEP